ncbi:6128_t:CDS:1, partial [Cetraspora pellucida]
PQNTFNIFINSFTTVHQYTNLVESSNLFTGSQAVKIPQQNTQY